MKKIILKGETISKVKMILIKEIILKGETILIEETISKEMKILKIMNTVT